MKSLEFLFRKGKNPEWLKVALGVKKELQTLDIFLVILLRTSIYLVTNAPKNVQMKILKYKSRYSSAFEEICAVEIISWWKQVKAIYHLTPPSIVFRVWF